MEFAKPRLQGGTARNLSDLSGRTPGMWLGGRPLIVDPRRGLADPLVAHAARLRPGLACAPGFRPPQQPPRISRPGPGKHLARGPSCSACGSLAPAARLCTRLPASTAAPCPIQPSSAQARTLPPSRTITARVISSTCGPPPMYAYAWAISVSHRCWAECPNSARATSSSRSSPKNAPCSS